MGETLSTSGAEADEDLTPEFSYSELLAEIAALPHDEAQVRAPGWFDLDQVIQEWHYPDTEGYRNKARAKLSGYVNNKQLETTFVFDPQRRCRLQVWRKVK